MTTLLPTTLALRVYSAATPNGLKVPMALEELGLEYDLVELDLAAGEQEQPAFLRVNPNGRIPALLDTRHGIEVPVFESGAILLHVAEAHGGLLPRDPLGRAAAISWLFLQVAALGPALGNVRWFERHDDGTQALALDRFRTESRRLVALVEARLQRVRWLAGDDYSIADIAHFGWLRQMDYAGLDPSDFPAIARWVADIEQRPATHAALSRLGMATTPDAAPVMCAIP